MDPTGIISAIFAGIIIGLIARILVPSMQPIGCIVTIIIGIIGAFAGIFVGDAFGYGDSFWLVFLTQIFIAVVLVAITAFLFRKSNTG
ncbi:MAG: GlsB/YeaQ/YmgE family stress response membrane protein [Actinomycetales bacterium]|nr:GlsB/YeaQ/YmgE family stress response membrane protein [Actinomycetales bacterium]